MHDYGSPLSYPGAQVVSPRVHHAVEDARPRQNAANSLDELEKTLYQQAELLGRLRDRLSFVISPIGANVKPDAPPSPPCSPLVGRLTQLAGAVYRHNKEITDLIESLEL